MFRDEEPIKGQQVERLSGLSAITRNRPYCSDFRVGEYLPYYGVCGSQKAVGYYII